MNIQVIKTETVTVGARSLTEILDAAITSLDEGSIVAITSKIVALADGDVIPNTGQTKNDLVPAEADYYLPPEHSKYGIVLSIKDNTLIPSAGIDESNSDNHFILWPKNPQKTANSVRKHLREKFNLKKLGVLITDSTTSPLRWGTTGIAIGYSGFKPQLDYIGTPDLFGKPMRVTKANVKDGLAAAAVLVMGEGSESTPIAIITDVEFIEFTDSDPSEDELRDLTIDKADDVYAPLLESVDWQEGKR